METKKSWKSFHYQTHAVWKQARQIKASAVGQARPGNLQPAGVQRRPGHLDA